MATLWTDSQHQMYRDIRGVAKACWPTLAVGWHVSRALDHEAVGVT
jgi:hypothetical protein